MDDEVVDRERCPRCDAPWEEWSNRCRACGWNLDDELLAEGDAEG